MNNTPVSSYQPPVDKLLTYGEADVAEAKDWPDYLKLGLTSEHIPALIRMATDKELNDLDTEKPEFWGPVHAWRALGQLHAIEAIEPLLTLFDTLGDSEWVAEEVPEVFSMIGPAALPRLAAFMSDSIHNEWARTNVASGVVYIGLNWPDARSTSVEILSSQLENFSGEADMFSTFLVSDLIQLEAKEAAPVIERAFAADLVDPGVVGTWDDVQFGLGLISEEEAAKRGVRAPSILPAIPAYTPTSTMQLSSNGNRSHRTTNKKAKNKMAKQSRKKNRKR